MKCQDNIYTILFFQNLRWVFLKFADSLKWSFEDVLLRDLLGFLPDAFCRAGCGTRLLPQPSSLPDLWLYHFRFVSCFLSTRFFLCSSLPAATGWLGRVGTSPSCTDHILSRIPGSQPGLCVLAGVWKQWLFVPWMTGQIPEAVAAAVFRSIIIGSGPQCAVFADGDSWANCRPKGTFSVARGLLVPCIATWPTNPQGHYPLSALPCADRTATEPRPLPPRPSREHCPSARKDWGTHAGHRTPTPALTWLVKPGSLRWGRKSPKPPAPWVCGSVYRTWRCSDYSLLGRAVLGARERSNTSQETPLLSSLYHSYFYRPAE